MRFSSKYGLHDQITIAGDIRALVTAVQFSGGGTALPDELVCGRGQPDHVVGRNGA